MPGNHVDSDLTCTNTASAWRKAGGCAHGDCVEVRRTAAGVEVRDSKQPDGPVLTFDEPAWRRLLSTLRADLRPAGVYRDDDGDVELWQKQAGRLVILTVSQEDWDAFVGGVRGGEFDLERLAAEVTR